MVGCLSYCWSTGCEFSTGPGTNASENLVGPVNKIGVILVKLIDYSCKVPSGPVIQNPKFAAWEYMV